MAIKSMKIVADYETTTDKNDVRAWGVGAVDIDTLQTVHLGNNMDDFMHWLSDKNTTCYFHNLKFDGEFILHYLLTHGYKYSDKRTDKTFECLITDDGVFYSITVYFQSLNKKYKKVTFYDSYKKLPFKVEVIAKAFELEDRKLEIDYHAYREPGHILTPEEEEYIVHDCRIVASALKIQFEQGLKKMTNASDAMSGFKSIMGKDRFEKTFPVLPVILDADIRRAYKGGYVYLNPRYKAVRGIRGVTLDVNSLYPSVMYDRLLPYGYPMYFEGEPNPDENYPLFIVHLKCCFELKPGHLPTIQLKNNRRFVETEYLTTSRVETKAGIEENEPVEMWLTNVDYALMMEHYDISEMTYINGYKFKGARGMFKEYIDHWMHIKETTTGALRQLAKLMLNSLYGRFALNPVAKKKIPFLDHDGVVRYKILTVKLAEEMDIKPPELRDPVYTAMGCFITAYARDKTIRSAQKVYDRFIYADTDSLHLEGQAVPDDLEVHPTKLGAWKNEGVFDDSIFLRAKTYMETVDGVTKVTCAGMPDNVKAQVTYENFHDGATFTGKLLPRRYPGGIVLVETNFTLKAS